MEPPPATSKPSPPPASAAAPPHVNYPDSVGSSPRSRTTDSWEDSAAPATRLRLMCSFGGHIVPRPHDKSLCYVGGETRIFVADRQTSLADLSGRLSNTVLNGRAFSLKYQLPNEDLDSLISVTTDEDLDNMIDEYDRTANSPKPSRLRLFLFPSKPDSSQSIGPILESSVKSDNWFLNALNGAGLLNRGFSVNCLLGLDDVNDPNTPTNAAPSEVRSLANSKSAKQVPDVLETSSSFGSTSSSPSLANLPPIRVHVEDGGLRGHDQRLGIEEQFVQIGGQKQDESFLAMSSPPPMPTTLTAAAMSSGMVAGEYMSRVVSDDERSDYGVPAGYRKPPTQSLLPQQQQKPSGGIDSASPDSVSSDTSVANALSRAKPVIYQEQLVQFPSGTSRVNANPVDPNTRIQMQQVIQDPGYVLQHQFDPQQRQFIQGAAHYIQHHPGGVPVPAYYPVYTSQQQQKQQHHHQVDQQYPVYYMPARPAQAYSINEAAPAGVPSMRNPPIAKPEMDVGMYRTGTPAPAVGSSQQQFVGFSQMQYPSQSVAPTTSAPVSYAYDYPEAPIYYTQPLAPTMSSAQYQTMMGLGAAPVGLPDGSAQHPNDAIKQQQVRTSQQI